MSFLSFISLVASFIYLPNIEREHFLRSSRMTVKYPALLSSLRDKRELFFYKREAPPEAVIPDVTSIFFDQ